MFQTGRHHDLFPRTKKSARADFICARERSLSHYMSSILFGFSLHLRRLDKILKQASSLPHKPSPRLISAHKKIGKSRFYLCAEGDLNSHALNGRYHLKVVRLPVSPSAQLNSPTINKKGLNIKTKQKLPRGSFCFIFIQLFYLFVPYRP